jgi:hypothetical protein
MHRCQPQACATIDLSRGLDLLGLFQSLPRSTKIKQIHREKRPQFGQINRLRRAQFVIGLKMRAELCQPLKLLGQTLCYIGSNVELQRVNRLPKCHPLHLSFQRQQM